MVRRAARGAAVAVTDRPRNLLRFVFLTGLILTSHSLAGVLPEDRADALYHSYDGGGVEVNGPSILVRKGDGKRFSVSANYYTDTISSASIDVVTQGSPYAEKRIQKSINTDYQHADTTMSFGFTNSTESDYKADTTSFSISQSMFGDLTTLTLGYSRGRDDVSRNNDPGFSSKNVDRHQYQINLSQILTKDMLVTLNYDGITEEGYLHNPYRSVRYLDTSNTVQTQEEIYPNTRTSNAIGARLKMYLPYRAALTLGYRYYTDDWDIAGHTFEVGYTYPAEDQWIIEGSYRYYRQSDAAFYSDLFPRVDAQNFLARDKELSRFSDHSLGLTATYEFLPAGWRIIDKATANLAYRHIWFYYDNFRNTMVTNVTPGTEPLYDFEADIVQAFVSLWY